MDITVIVAWTNILVAALAGGAYVFAFIVRGRTPRIAPLIGLCATILALLQLAASLLAAPLGTLHATYCGVFLAIAAIAQSAAALRHRTPTSRCTDAMGPADAAR